MEGHQIQNQALELDMEESVNSEFLLNYYCNKIRKRFCKSMIQISKGF